MNLLTITNEVLKIKNVSIKCVRILDIVPHVKNFKEISETLYVCLVLARDNPKYNSSILSGHMVVENTLKRI